MKDPAFLFYSQDFLVGTMTMSLEDKGRYITILCMMHQNGRLPEETIRLLVGSVSVTLKRKFSVDENGLWFNERLEKEVDKRKLFVETRRNNGKLGGRPKNGKEPLAKPKGKPLGKAGENLIENENNDSIIVSKGKEYYKAELDLNKDKDKIEFYRSFANFIFKNNPSGKPVEHILKIPNQMPYHDFCKLYTKVNGDMTNLFDKLASMMNDKNYTKKKEYLFLTLNDWINRDLKRAK